MEQPPIIDGHLWVVKDGKIIDPHFKNYDMICCIRGVSTEKHYLPADITIQKVIIKKWIKFLNKIDLKNWKNMPNFCFINAIAYNRKYGGELDFGSLGFGKKNKIWWEFGGVDWSLLQFLKKS